MDPSSEDVSRPPVWRPPDHLRSEGVPVAGAKEGYGSRMEKVTPEELCMTVRELSAWLVEQPMPAKVLVVTARTARAAWRGDEISPGCQNVNGWLVIHSPSHINDAQDAMTVSELAAQLSDKDPGSRVALTTAMIPAMGYRLSADQRYAIITA